MNSLQNIEAAIAQLPKAEAHQLLNWLQDYLDKDAQPIVKLTPLEPIPQRHPAKAGSAKGLVWIADDFDQPLEDFKEYME